MKILDHEKKGTWGINTKAQKEGHDKKQTTYHYKHKKHVPMKPNQGFLVAAVKHACSSYIRFYLLSVHSIRAAFLRN